MMTFRTLCSLAPVLDTKRYVLKTKAAVFFVCLICLCASARAEVLLVDAANDSLYTVNPSSGAATLVGPLGFSFNSISGLAYDPNSSTLYYSGLTSVGLHSVNLCTGKGTKIGNLAVNMPGLAYDAKADVLYGISGFTDSLYSIDPANAALTLIGPLGVNIGRNGAAYDAEDGLLYMVTETEDLLYSVNPNTGQATLIGSVGEGLDINGLTSDPFSGQLYGASGTTDSLYELSKTSGAATLIGPLGIDVDTGVGLAFAAEPPPNWFVYAEGKTEPAGDGSGVDLDTFAGISTHLGKFTGEGAHITDFNTGAFEGFATYTAANGDELYVTYFGQITNVDFDAEYVLQGIARFEITGGTGRLKNAKGCADAIGGFTGVPGNLFFELEGTLHPQGK